MTGGSFPIDVTRAEIEDLALEYARHAGDCRWVSEHIDRLYDVIARAISYRQIAVSGIELLNAIFSCIIARDDYRRWRQILVDALLHAQNLRDNEFQMQLWAELGQNNLQFGLRKEAYEAFTMTSERGEDYDAPEMELLGKIGQVRTQAIYQKGHYKDLVPEILALAKQIDKPFFHAMTHSALSLGYTLRHETLQALEHGQIAYIWWYKLNNYDQKADTAFLMAQACRLASRIEQSNRYIRLAEKQIQNPDHVRKLAVSDYTRGSVELEGHKNPAEAEKWFLSALERFSRLDYPYLTAATHHALGVTQTKLGKFADARSNLKAALSTWSDLNNKFEQASVIYAIGFLRFRQQKTGSALRWYNRCLKMLEGIADSPSRQQLETRLHEDVNEARDKLRPPGGHL